MAAAAATTATTAPKWRGWPPCSGWGHLRIRSSRSAVQLTKVLTIETQVANRFATIGVDKECTSKYISFFHLRPPVDTSLTSSTNPASRPSHHLSLMNRRVRFRTHRSISAGASHLHKLHCRNTQIAPCFLWVTDSHQELLLHAEESASEDVIGGSPHPQQHFTPPPHTCGRSRRPVGHHQYRRRRYSGEAGGGPVRRIEDYEQRWY